LQGFGGCNLDVGVTFYLWGEFLDLVISVLHIESHEYSNTNKH